MTTTTNEPRATRERIVRDHFEDEVRHAWDDVLSTFPHPRYELIPMGVVHDGDTEVREYYRDTRVAFPDQRHEIIKLRHSEDAVIVEFYLLGTHLGPFGAIPPTGNKFKVRMTAFFVFEGETLVCERIYFDVLTIFKQLLGGLNFKKPGTYLLVAKALRGAVSSLGNQGKPRDAAHLIGE
jgi:predicted ester cyclase